MQEDNSENSLLQAGNQAHLIHIGAEAVELHGIFHRPLEASGLVILAHGIEDQERNPHQNIITLAEAFHQHGLATIQVDLFSSDELALDERTAFFRQNIGIMHQRLVGTAEWFQENASTDNLSIGYFGMNEVGAAALAAAATRPDLAAAVVVAGNTYNLAQAYTARVWAPTLLLAAEQDQATIRSNNAVLEQLASKDKRQEIIAGESALFVNQHSLNEVIRLAGGWFVEWLVAIV